MILNELSILENGKKQTDRNQNHIVSQLIKLCHKISHEKRDAKLYKGRKQTVKRAADNK